MGVASRCGLQKVGIASRWNRCSYQEVGVVRTYMCG